MCVRYLGFVLLAWLPVVLYGQTVELPCSPPELNDGYFVPQEKTYRHGNTLTYSCETGFKPVVEGWWATSTCQNGKWSHTPQCIGDTCMPHSSRLTLFVNLKYLHTCSEPPKIPSAIIINQDYQEVFALDSEVEYQCKHGFTTEEGATKKSVFCRAGLWTDSPTCSKWTVFREIQTTSPEELQGSTSQMRPSVGWKTSCCALHNPSCMKIDNCGEFPDVLNGVMVRQSERSLTYECQMFYKLVGSGTVVCHSGGSWSAVPTCKEDYCVLRAGVHPKFTVTADVYFKNGEAKELKCTGRFLATHYSVVRCIDGNLIASECKYQFKHHMFIY
uniref:Sushi domain-containing protein n=1 Tax=Fundulus heteroclitus TaxID=8078 RepID=A0A3Q2QS57_FUNHE